MCGIVGIANSQTSVSLDVIRKMTDQLSHRGPDDEGIWQNRTGQVALGHRRLAILDLSPLGHQPMSSPSGRYTIAYNGEVYNFRELAATLGGCGHTFRSRSDTEVLLAAFEQWGLVAALEKLNGMFAFALWDNQEHCLYLVRDRMGIKPLYYGWIDQSFVFASELKAVVAHPKASLSIDRESLLLMLQYAYIPSPYCIYDRLYKLPPGSYLRIDLHDTARGNSDFSPLCQSAAKLHPVPYWSLTDIAEEGRRNPFCGSDREAATELERLLQASVARRMIADVPCGAFLSGGIDSSTVVAMMQSSSRNVRTFSIGFDQPAYNETDHAREIADHLGTQHTELQVDGKQALEVVPRLPTMFDEPFADPSQIPMFLVSQLARRSVVVSLSGDGGDELFAGYNRYTWPERLWPYVERIPRPARRVFSYGVTRFAPKRWESLGNFVEHLLPTQLRFSVPGEKMHKLARAMHANSVDSFYDSMMGQWRDPETLLAESPAMPTEATDCCADMEFAPRMMCKDQLRYLPDDLLAKVDRSSMAVSLEVRVPILDHEVVRFAWSLPHSMKHRDGETKWILRRVLENYVPRPMFNRPKMGFSVPIDAWLRGPLREWGEELLDQKRLRREGFFNPKPIRRAWQDHQRGRANRQYGLWNVLMFQAWLESHTRN